MTTHPQPIEIRAGDLKPALAGLAKLIPRSPSLIVLGCVKIEPNGKDSLRLTATDLDLTLSVEIPAKVERAITPFLLPLPRLREMVAEMRSDETVRLGPAIKAPPAAEFPEIPMVRTPGLTLPETVVTSLLRAFACASQDSTRAVLRSACLDTSGTGDKAHRIVGTNGRHLFSSNSMHLPLKQSVIIPDHPLWKWKPLAEIRPWTLRLGKDKHQAEVFRVDGHAWSVTGRLLDGPYPNYRQVIPRTEEFKTTVTLSDAALEAITRLLPRLPGKQLANRPVGLHCEKGRFGLLARAENDEPWILHPVDRCEMKGPDVTVYLDRDYLVKAAAFGLHRISLIDQVSPMQFSRGGDLMIVMPVRAITPDRIERPRLPPAVELFAPATVPTRKTVVPKKTQAPPLAPAPPTAPQPSPVAPTKRPVKIASKQAPKPDPLRDAREQVAEADEALLTARRTLKGVRRSLHAARTERSETKRELGGFRGLLRKLQRGRKHEAKKAP
jgi:DNA polymerase III sliding clamp (beta) subunit (PCNA family)